MRRTILSTLKDWSAAKNRKVLLLRGARQVGKTYIVRELAKDFTHFVEVNFEKNTDVKHFFDQNLDPDRICANLSAYYGIPVVDGKTLLFFDEIQSCPKAIQSLRFFYESKPGLHVIAAGSLLEFALEDLTSWGVGRIRSLYMYPMSFDEFLLAYNKDALIELKKSYVDMLNKGNIAEAFAGLEMMKYASAYEKRPLYYWHREKRGSSAEVDYLAEVQGQVIPVEIKSGSTGKMQSMYRFLDEKKAPWGIRMSLENFSAYDKIRVIPLYAVSNILK